MHFRMLTQAKFSSFYAFQDVNASKIFSEEAQQIYERAISGPLRKNQLLYFAYADFEESRLHYQEVHKIYLRYIEMDDVDPTLVGDGIFRWWGMVSDFLALMGNGVWFSCELWAVWVFRHNRDLYYPHLCHVLDLMNLSFCNLLFILDR